MVESALFSRFKKKKMKKLKPQKNHFLNSKFFQIRQNKIDDDDQKN